MTPPPNGTEVFSPLGNKDVWGRRFCDRAEENSKGERTRHPLGVGTAGVNPAARFRDGEPPGLPRRPCPLALSNLLAIHPGKGKRTQGFRPESLRGNVPETGLEPARP